MKAVRFISADDVEAAVPIEPTELVRITITPRGKKLVKRTAVVSGFVLTAGVAVAINRSTKARMVANTVASAANEVKEEVTA